ncbi:MAG TPA: hypothetical protein VFT56_04565 [Sphingomonas sp.]|nr:hypothetical protein [Sphingomonas sp.]
MAMTFNPAKLENAKAANARPTLFDAGRMRQARAKVKGGSFDAPFRCAAAGPATAADGERRVGRRRAQRTA